MKRKELKNKRQEEKNKVKKQRKKNDAVCRTPDSPINPGYVLLYISCVTLSFTSHKIGCAYHFNHFTTQLKI